MTTTGVSAKLISLSLDKIKQSRQKTGLNLRRSLLVASVLHKAKDIYITEIKNRQANAVNEQKQLPKKPKLFSQNFVIEQQTQPSYETTDNNDTMDSTTTAIFHSSATDLVCDSPVRDYDAETTAATADISSDS